MEMMAHTVLILVTVNLSLDFSWDCTSALLLSQFFSSHLFSSLSSLLFLCLSKSFLDDFSTELDLHFMLSVLKNRKKEGKLTCLFSVEDLFVRWYVHVVL